MIQVHRSTTTTDSYTCIGHMDQHDKVCLVTVDVKLDFAHQMKLRHRYERELADRLMVDHPSYLDVPCRRSDKLWVVP